jgi:cobalamin synthase
VGQTTANDSGDSTTRIAGALETRTSQATALPALETVAARRLGYCCRMSDLTPSSGGRVSRRTREQRAYRLHLIGGGAGAVAVVSFVLAIAGVIGSALFLVSAIVSVVAVLLFRRAVSRR